jgi:membrane dipeptidase
MRLNSTGHIDLPRLRAGGVTLQFFAICTALGKPGGYYLKQGLEYVNRYDYCLLENRDALAGIKTLADLADAEKEGKIACLLALEGAEPLEGSLELLDIFFRLGVRCLSPTWNNRNWFADGINEAAAGGGLTVMGRKAIQIMAEKGIILDLAHISPRGYFEALEIAPCPPLVSHTNARRLCDHPRNLTDEQIRALAEKGGAVGISFYPPFVSGQETARLDQLVDHFIHVAAVAGVEHVAIGSDFDGIQSTVDGINDASCYGILQEALAERGFNETELELVSGGNVKRLLRLNLPESDCGDA